MTEPGRPSVFPSPDGEEIPPPPRPAAENGTALVVGAAFGSALSLFFAALSGVEPMPVSLPLFAVAGASFALVVATRRRRAGGRIRPVPLLALGLAMAMALVVAVEVPYLWWLGKTARELADKEWRVLAGMRPNEVREILGEPTSVSPFRGEVRAGEVVATIEGERWIYERRFLRLPRYRAVLVFRSGQLRKSMLDPVVGRKLIWVRPKPVAFGGAPGEEGEN
jgi:hypothetical protein